MTEFLINHLG